MSNHYRHARACPGHPRLDGLRLGGRSAKRSAAARKTWMAGDRRAEATPSFRRLCPVMTKSVVAGLSPAPLRQHLFQDTPANVLVGRRRRTPPPAVLLHFGGGVGEAFGDLGEIRV